MKRVRVKICGVTRPQDAEAAARLGADAVGLNFFARSPRCVSLETARAILRSLPPFVEPIAVLVADPVDEAQAILAAVGNLGIHHIQMHQTATRRFFPGGAGTWRCLAAFSVADRADLELIRAIAAERVTARAPLSGVLVDARVPGLHGGTGQTAPWELLAGFDPGPPLVLAGGLTPDNVAQAIRIVQPWAVDVASGVESAPGIKDHDKLRRFLDNART